MISHRFSEKKSILFKPYYMWGVIHVSYLLNSPWGCYFYNFGLTIKTGLNLCILNLKKKMKYLWLSVTGFCCCCSEYNTLLCMQMTLVPTSRYFLTSFLLNLLNCMAETVLQPSSLLGGSVVSDRFSGEGSRVRTPAALMLLIRDGWCCRLLLLLVSPAGRYDVHIVLVLPLET